MYQIQCPNCGQFKVISNTIPIGVGYEDIDSKTGEKFVSRVPGESMKRDISIGCVLWFFIGGGGGMLVAELITHDITHTSITNEVIGILGLVIGLFISVTLVRTFQSHLERLRQEEIKRIVTRPKTFYAYHYFCFNCFKQWTERDKFY